MDGITSMAMSVIVKERGGEKIINVYCIIGSSIYDKPILFGILPMSGWDPAVFTKRRQPVRVYISLEHNWCVLYYHVIQPSFHSHVAPVLVCMVGLCP